MRKISANLMVYLRFFSEIPYAKIDAFTFILHFVIIVACKATDK